VKIAFGQVQQFLSLFDTSSYRNTRSYNRGFYNEIQFFTRQGRIGGSVGVMFFVGVLPWRICNQNFNVWPGLD